MLVALSFDRWEAVVRPLAFIEHRRHGPQLILGAWILGAVSSMPTVFYAQVQEIDGIRACFMDLSSEGWKYYMLYLLFTVLMIPTTLIAICYIHIVYTIWSKSKLTTTDRVRAKMNQVKVQTAPPSRLDKLQGGKSSISWMEIVLDIAIMLTLSHSKFSSIIEINPILRHTSKVMRLLI